MATRHAGSRDLSSRLTAGTCATICAVTRNVIITGAARGIGAAIARRLSADGWGVALVDICAGVPSLPYDLATEAELEAAATACPGKTVTFALDVREAPALEAAAATAAEQLGGLSGAIAAAGAIAGGPPLWETSDAVWAAMVDINLTGVFNLARATIPLMLEQPEPRVGRFIAIASAAAEFGLPQLAAYSAAKHGVGGIIKSLAAELGSAGITANAVSPGSTATAMLDATGEIYGVQGPEDFAEHARLHRLISPDEVAATVAWLCAEESSAVTGAMIPVDGGFLG